MDSSLRIMNARMAVLSMKDRVTVYQLPKFKEAFEGAQKKIGARKCLILDLSSMGFMDPLALGVLVAFSRIFREKGGEIKIVNANGELNRIFEESRLAKVYETYGSVEEAERAFV